MKSLETLEARIARATKFLSLIGFLGLMGIAAMTVGDVLMRWLLNAPIHGVLDVSGLAIAIVIASCFPAGILQRHNVAIRFLGSAIGRRGNEWLETFGAAVLLAFFVLIAWQFVVYTNELTAAGEHTWILEWRMAPWWWVTTLLIMICVPLQALVTIMHLVGAVSGRPIRDGVTEKSRKDAGS